MNLRDWLIVVGVVIIVGILLDGYRRMRLAKKDSLKMSLEMGGDIDTSPLDDGFNPELPGGGARVVKSDLDENISTDEVLRGDKLEPHISTDDKHSLSLDGLTNDGKGSISQTNDQHGLSSTLSEGPLIADANSRIQVEESETTLTTNQIDNEPVVNTGEVNQAKVNAEEEQLVIVLNVHSQEGSFPGVEIKKLLEACGLDHGEMSIFHRHEEDDLLSPIQFSVANAVEPGYFDPDTLDEIATPGVSFFMSLPGPKDYMKAFDYMLETAQCFARNLKGDLKDQDRSMMTAQTIEHCRRQIKEFERKQLSKNRV